MEFNPKTIPLVDRRRPRRHVVLEHVARGVANLPIFPNVDVRGREVAGVARPRAVEAAHRVDDAVAARLHKGLGRQIPGIKKIVQVSLVARHALVVAVVRVDLVQEPRLEVDYGGLSSHIATAAKYRLVAEPVPLGPAPAISDPTTVKGAVANLFEGPAPDQASRRRRGDGVSPRNRGVK